MIPEFEKLTEEETELLLKTPILVSILIAGADNEIDKSEIKKAVSISKEKKKRARASLLDFYNEVAEHFEDKLLIMIHSFPPEAQNRNPIIIDELERLNDILPKLDRQFAIEFYESVKEIAKKIAEASGGVLGYMAVGYEESKLLELKMIDNPSK
ncbi:MAG: hypothetical protein OEX22_10995 [Cyclobacteriaceae bacterium]|nr:hypothetical protein [Cyclobacteriaceae bacterium]